MQGLGKKKKCLPKTLKNRNNLGFKECVIYIDFQIIYWKTVRNVKKKHCWSKIVFVSEGKNSRKKLELFRQQCYCKPTKGLAMCI